jgi:methylenetetrahydrofolate reductase (NADPH)
MHLRDIFNSRRTTFSFEFFPPKTDAAGKSLFESATELERLRPTFVSVTYGAGGSTRERTHDLVVRLKRETSLQPFPHLTCVAHTEDEITRILERYAQAGIANIVALRGDMPRPVGAGGGLSVAATGGGGGPGGGPSAGVVTAFDRACDLVKHIRAFGDRGGHPDKGGFGIAVAGYPEGHHETPNRVKEMDYLKAKVDAGADAIITQMFFDNRDFYDFRARCELAGIKVPIIAGVMPITSLANMHRMAELALGTRFPAALVRAVMRAGEVDAAVERVGTHWATEQCRDLLDNNVAGLHLYTLNKSKATQNIYLNLGVSDSDGLAKCEAR